MRTLATDEIGKSYRGRRVVNGVSLRVEQGEVVGLLGPNGAGKTTTFYSIVGLIPPDTGRVLIDAEDITDVPMYLRARQYGISYLPQEASVFRKLTVEEIISDLREAGIGVLITDHNVRETLSVTGRAYIINEGRIFRQGTPEQLGGDPEVRRVYLGESFSLV